MVDAFLAMSSNRVLNRSEPERSWRTPMRRGHVGGLMFLARLSGGPLGLRTPGILESRGGAGIDRKETKIETEGEMIVGIIAVMNPLIEIGIEGETIAGDPRGIVIGTVRGADVTGGDVMIADRLIHEGCGR